jgi:hypothetical protein
MCYNVDYVVFDIANKQSVLNLSTNTTLYTGAFHLEASDRMASAPPPNPLRVPTGLYYCTHSVTWCQLSVSR